MRAFYLKNFRQGLATNSSSTHSVIYRKKDDMFKDLDIFELDFYDRCDSTIAATKEAKIKYVLANIMYDGPLVKAMTALYPQMKKYLPKVRKAVKACSENGYKDEYAFGMYFRGELYSGENMELDIDYLTHIIENDDMVIVGGSDEMDFVYDTIEGHEKFPGFSDLDRPSSFERGKMINKNGNYWVGFGRVNKPNCSLGRIRFAVSDSPLVPKYPELIDLRITNRCNHGCKFCFMDSTMKEKDADFEFLSHIICSPSLSNVEFSIGGGSVILYPQLEELLRLVRDGGHIANVTINVKDCDTIMGDERLTRIFSTLVDGVGISITDASELGKAEEFRHTFRNNIYYASLHIIPEYLGVEKTKKILDENHGGNRWFDVLFLGYKTNGRGASQQFHTFTDDDLSEIIGVGNYLVNIDTTFANRYRAWIEKNFESKEQTVTYNEGEYSMYIDGVTKNAYKSSYQLDKPYNMDYRRGEDCVTYTVLNAFKAIREDGGFPTEVNKKEEIDRYYR